MNLTRFGLTLVYIRCAICVTLGIHDVTCIKFKKSAYLLDCLSIIYHKIMSMLVDENFPAEIYIEPNDR